MQPDDWKSKHFQVNKRQETTNYVQGSWHLSTTCQMTTLVPCTSVKAGCLCRDMLTHLCLNAVDVVESSAK